MMFLLTSCSYFGNLRTIRMMSMFIFNVHKAVGVWTASGCLVERE